VRGIVLLPEWFVKLRTKHPPAETGRGRPRV
jgi:hypothetical protein